MAEKKAEIPRNSSSRPRKGRGKGKNSSPRLVLDLGKILPKVSSSTSSSPDDPSRTWVLSWGWVWISLFWVLVLRLNFEFSAVLVLRLVSIFDVCNIDIEIDIEISRNWYLSLVFPKHLAFVSKGKLLLKCKIGGKPLFWPASGIFLQSSRQNENLIALV